MIPACNRNIFFISLNLQFIGIKIANNPSNTLHYLQKAHLSSDTKLIDLADTFPYLIIWQAVGKHTS